MDIGTAMRICFSKDIKVYPVRRSGLWVIQVNFKGSLKSFDVKLSSSKEVNDAMTKTYKYYANKLTK